MSFLGQMGVVQEVLKWWSNKVVKLNTFFKKLKLN